MGVNFECWGDGCPRNNSKRRKQRHANVAPYCEQRFATALNSCGPHTSHTKPKDNPESHKWQQSIQNSVPLQSVRTSREMHVHVNMNIEEYNMCLCVFVSLCARMCFWRYGGSVTGVGCLCYGFIIGCHMVVTPHDMVMIWNWKVGIK